jgi:2-oxoacid:acceptor oxidoreductase gamma subunit (pyruvate/2-ketoisovalerate family)
MLATAFFEEGNYVQTFPIFGAERRGSPVAAYLRVDQDTIWERCNMLHPDHVVVMEANLFEEVNPIEGLKEGGHLIINSPLPADSFKGLDGYRVSTFDCGRVAAACGLGDPPTPIINTVMLGAFAKLTGMIRLESAIQGIERWVSVKAERNIEAAQRAFEDAALPVGG